MLFEEEEEYTKKKTWKDYLIQYSYIIIAFLFMLFFRGRLGTMVWDKAIFGGIAIILIGTLFLLVYPAWKNATPKIVYNYGFDTTDGELISCGNYFIARPALKAFGMYWKLSGAYIFPLDAVEKVGPNLVIKARMERVPIEQIPLVPQSYIIQHGIKPPYYLGFADEEQYAEVVEDPEQITGQKKPSVGFLIKEIKELLELNTFLRKIVKGKWKDIEDMVEWAKRVGKKETLVDMLKESLLERT